MWDHNTLKEPDEDDIPAALSLNSVWDKVRTVTFIKWLKLHHFDKPSSIRNRCIHMSKLLKQLKRLSALSRYVDDIKKCRQLYKETAADAAVLNKRSVYKKP